MSPAMPMTPREMGQNRCVNAEDAAAPRPQGARPWLALAWFLLLALPALPGCKTSGAAQPPRTGGKEAPTEAQPSPRTSGPACPAANLKSLEDALAPVQDMGTRSTLILVGLAEACTGMPRVMADALQVDPQPSNDASQVGRFIQSKEGGAIMARGCPDYLAMFNEIGQSGGKARVRIFKRCGWSDAEFMTEAEWEGLAGATRIRVLFLCPWLRDNKVTRARVLCRLAAGLSVPKAPEQPAPEGAAPEEKK